MNLSQYSSVEILSALSTLAAVGFVALYWFPGIALSIASLFRRVLGLPSISFDTKTRRTRFIENWAPLLGLVEITDQPSAKFASMSFDACGFADPDDRTPIASSAATCAEGRSLREVRERLLAQQPSAQKLVCAAFGCNANNDNGPSGDWTLRNSDQRR